MLRAALGRGSGRCGGLWRNPCSAAASGSARAPSAASASSGSGSGGGARSGGASPADASNVKPLDGVKILDLTRVLAGPFATMNLGDLGAEVIKVERPGAGDDTRAWGPPFAGTESVYFLSVNRNKKSIAINMKDSKGAKLIRELAAASDVFVENYIPGKLAEMGLGYEDIKNVAPHIVYCSITGYGQTGPVVQRGGYDSIAAAVSGLMHITGHEDGEPVKMGVAMTDLATGLYTYGAIMAGLLQRYKTGKGLHIDCNLLSTQAFKTKDGYIVVGAGNDHQFVTVCKVLNLPEVSKDSRYQTNALRVRNRRELIDVLSTRFSEKTTIEWLQLFEGSGVPYGPINNMQQVFSDPQVLHNGLVMEMNHPTAGRIAVPGPGVRYSEFDVSHPKPPPLVGQHTVEILKSMLGYEDDAIEELLRTGAVAQHEVR
ncbi:PREDICTED: succinate--hydroxymethylglutarate CoA-transferase isoform X2 [Lepidothrix coronata]|uniref:Succinate--hydroxymethylglutarate CoA-transferase isoform X2 n=1 Tax=Lepidothrix coronata TaxID=321398 RepID=A0A6J0HWF8_9PASS|nr:PREDICTED: succinate--hydroxymethylglutarate CoA-transferase isoform X2 [Lepidothrix coronata]